MNSMINDREGVLSKIRAVVLDYGEVLCKLPTPQAITRMANAFRMPPESFLSTYLAGRIPYDRGDLLPHAYWKNFASEAGVSIDDKTIDQVRQWDLDLWSNPNEPMIRWLEQVHSAGYKTAILSNMPSDMVEHVMKNFSWIDYFDHHVFSADVRSAKPEPEIYQHLIETLGVKPSETLFIDDREANLEQARAAGIQTIQFHSVEQLRRDLQARHFAVLPEVSG